MVAAANLMERDRFFEAFVGAVGQFGGSAVAAPIFSLAILAAAALAYRKGVKA